MSNQKLTANLYEILVPTIYGDTLKPISTKCHKNWDSVVRVITGGLTILTPAKGQWLNNDTLYIERVIPVRVMCDEKRIKKVIEFTIKHYRQRAVMYYLLSQECNIVFA